MTRGGERASEQDSYAFLTHKDLDEVFARLDRELGDWRQIEVVGSPGVGKTHFCSAYRNRSGCALGNRALSNRLIRPHLRPAEQLGRLFLPRRKRADIRHRAVMRAVSSLRPQERAFLTRLLAVLEEPLAQELKPERRAALEYCASEAPAAVLRAAHLHRENIKALLDEGVLKLLLGFLRWFPGEVPNPVIAELRACLAAYPGERCAAFLDAPPLVTNARRAQRGDAPKSETPHEGSLDRLFSLCEQTGWRALRVEMWRRA